MNLIYAYNNGSKSAKALSQALGIKLARHEGKPINVDNLINWGATRHVREIYEREEVLNPPANVAIACNKLSAFKRLAEEGFVHIPEFTTKIEEAIEWRMNGDEFVARTVLNGHSGEGIILSDGKAVEELMKIKAPLYTKYIKKKAEYRFHVMGGKVFHVQRKARKHAVPDAEVNWKVRNLAGGFIYEIGDPAKFAAKELEPAWHAVVILNLDFGAVDVVHGTDGKWYVLEVNTAPGLEGTTLDKYVEAFKERL